MTADAMVSPVSFAFAHAETDRRPPKAPMDEQRFEAFYKKTAGGVWSYIYRLTGSPSTADDLLQKTFFKFVRSNPTLSNDEHMRRYVYKAATNLVFDHFRDSKRERGRPVELPPSELRADRGDLRYDMMRVFAELKPQERALLWLAHVEGYSHEEIADSLDVKAKSVKVLLFRARKRLADLLKQKGLGPESLS